MTDETTQSSEPGEAPGKGSPQPVAGVREGAAMLGGPGGDGASVDPAAESDLWVGRTHWKHFAGRLTLWVLGNVAAGVLIIWIASQFESDSARFAFWGIVIVLVVSGFLVVGRVLLSVFGHR